MSDRSILDWFGKRKENSVNDGSRSHVVAVLDTVSELGASFVAMAEGDTVKATKSLERLMLSEQEADRIEDRLAAEISRGEMTVQERENLIAFVRKTDKVANWAKEAAIQEQLILETRASVPTEIWKELADMAEELKVEVRFLQNAIEDMRDDYRGAMANVDAVFDQERVIDGMYFVGIKHAHLSDMDPKDVLLVDNIINAVEMSADNCKSCGDTINILIASKGV